MLRSVAAVMAGIVSMMLLVGVCTAVAARCMMTDAQAPSAGYIAVNLLCSIVAAMVGGYLSGLIAGRAPLRHALALAGVICVLGVLSLSTPQPGQPDWYGTAILVIGVTGVLAGGWLRAAQRG